MFFFLAFLFSAKSENRNPPHREGLAPMGRGKWWEKGGRRVNMVQKMCTHACKCKNDTY
jgi:hypothetical protein